MKNKYDIRQFVDVPTRQSVLSSMVERMVARRKESKMTQKQLAERSGVSYGSLRRFEQEGEISLVALLKIAQALGCLEDFEQLFATPKITDLKEFKV